MSLALVVIAFGGAMYLLIAAARLAIFSRERAELASEFLPSVTILKPVAGLEQNLYENLASFCDQEYAAAHEIIFCLHRADDPALEVVERVVADFSTLTTTIAIGEAPEILNPKIANLAKRGVEPAGEIVVIADSDIRVGRDYLKALAALFDTQRVGAVTCLYAGMPNSSIAARLGALQIEDGFAPSVLVATALGKLRFCLGASMAVRRSVLQEIGGLRALGETIADDHLLGQLVARRGYSVELSRYTVKTAVAETTLPQLWAHELRWARTNFALAPAGYVFSFLMYAVPFALLACAVSPHVIWAVTLLGGVVALRLLVHYMARSALAVTRPDDAWLIPLRDFLSLGVWATSLFGRRRSFR